MGHHLPRTSLMLLDRDAMTPRSSRATMWGTIATDTASQMPGITSNTRPKAIPAAAMIPIATTVNILLRAKRPAAPPVIGSPTISDATTRLVARLMKAEARSWSRSAMRIALRNGVATIRNSSGVMASRSSGSLKVRLRNSLAPVAWKLSRVKAPSGMKAPTDGATRRRHTLDNIPIPAVTTSLELRGVIGIGRGTVTRPGWST